MKIKLGVIFGGKTVEHEISVISAVQAMEYMDTEKYEIIPIYITKDLEWYTGPMLMDIESYKDFSLIKKYAKKVNLINKKGRFVLQSTGFLKREINEIDLAFPIVHGYGMEDGTIQGYLELVGVPYVGSNIFASSVGQDKVFMKQLFEINGLPVCKYVSFFDDEFLKDPDLVSERISTLKYPVILKPARLGSSVGIVKVDNADKLKDAIEEVIKYDNKILVEEMVENLTECNCAVLGNYTKAETSVIEEVLKEDEILSYRDKYIGGSKTGSSKGMTSARRIMPARISEVMRKQIEEYSLLAFKILNDSGVVRFDYLIDKKSNKIYINEANTCPGSLSYYLWQGKNISYPELLETMINIAIKEYKNKEKKIFSFETNILQNQGVKGLKGIKK